MINLNFENLFSKMIRQASFTHVDKSIVNEGTPRISCNRCEGVDGFGREGGGGIGDKQQFLEINYAS